MSKEKCPICNKGKAEINSSGERDIYFCDCWICSKYNITVPAYKDFIKPEKHKDERYILSGYLRQAYEENRKTPVITLENYKEIINSTELPSDIFDQFEKIIIHIFNKPKGYDDYCDLRWQDYSICYAKGPEEFSYFLEKMFELGYLKSRGGYVDVFYDRKYRLSLNGLRKYEEIKKRGKDSRQIFVAMWFDDNKEFQNTDLKKAYEKGFKDAIESTGHTPRRIDYLEHDDFIPDKIISEIKRSRAMVADLTGSRGSVYFEAGFAMGLSIHVIWTCHETEFDKRQFDVKQVNTIKWKDHNDLKEKLIKRIEATIGKLN